ncbi:MAG: DUF4157 domain-containing protein [Bacteroidales bacterium]|nr:DUF4157 domain-containing protein [Bacteroidales bacterium]
MKKVFRRRKRVDAKKEESTPFFKSPDAANSFIHNNGAQAKLKIGEPNDAYEKQADSVADSVVNSNQPIQKAQEEETQAKAELQKANEEETSAKLEVQKEEEESSMAQAQEEENQAKLELQKNEDETQAKLELQKEEQEDVQSKADIQKESDSSIAKASEDKESQAKLDIQKEEDDTQAKIIQAAEQEENQAKPEVQKANEDDTQAKPELQKEEQEDVQSKLLIQRKGEKGEAKPSLESRIKEAKNAGGSPLSDNLRAEMEDKFGAKFSKVRIHTDKQAHQLCKELGAQAFTNGSHIFFNVGKFQPDTQAGKHLLAHELTHVVQQRK